MPTQAVVLPESPAIASMDILTSNPLRPGTFELADPTLLIEAVMFLRTKGARSPHTQRRYQTELEKFLVFMGPRPLSAIDEWLLMDYQQMLLTPSPALQYHPVVRFNPVSEILADQYMHALKSFINQLASKHQLNYNPARLVPAIGVQPDAAPDTHKIFTHEQWGAVNATLDQLLVDTPGQRNRAERLRFCIHFAYAMGLRISEQAEHGHHHIIETRGKWQLKIIGKGKRARTLGLATVDNVALSALSRYRAALGLSAMPKGERLPLLPVIKPVIIKTRGSNKGCRINEAPIKPDNWRGQFKRFLRVDVMDYLHGDNADFKKTVFEQEWAHLTPHSLRHTRITHLIECGKDLLWVQQFAGHERLDTTSIYFRADL